MFEIRIGVGVEGDVPEMRRNPLPSYQPAFTAPRRAVGRALMEVCLNCSRPLLWTTVSSFFMMCDLNIKENHTVCPRESTP